MFNLPHRALTARVSKSGKHLALILSLLCVFLASSSDAVASYYSTAGTYQILSDVKVLDYPDSRASSIYELHAGDTIKTDAVNFAQQISLNSYAFLTKLLAPTTRWMVLQLHDGKIGFVNKDSNVFNKVGDEKADIPDEAIDKVIDAVRVKYIKQAKKHLSWLGIAIASVFVLIIISKITDSDLIGLIAGFIIIASLFGLVFYFWVNPHSMWFVSPSIVGWGTTLLCIFPTFFFSMFFIGEFIGSIGGMFKNPTNFIGMLLFAAIVYLMCRAVYWEVTDLFAVLIFSLSGAGVRSSSEYGTLIDQTTGKTLTGVRFSGNKAHSGNRTFTNDGSGYFE